ncbi:hypothetical protein LK429_00095 [Hoylesella buccalis]|uniref:hypothetical protein n=1 Tax=Hoylesella buccalis TaxID=28127 RepID=UPI001D13DA4F|nr:hypothetical protein [Hoylesella buccalis]UEA63026.1 hypothetical protein LK429_00095 [Hoylesella buccalis]UWP49684.1 hypothetical protein NQ518_01020 [Hoylesella buccalis ATCC 35310]
MRFPTKYIATYSINGGEEIRLESPNLHLLDKQVRHIIKGNVDEKGFAEFEIRRIFSDQERHARNIPDRIHGEIDRHVLYKNGKWKYDKFFRNYY